MCRSDPRSLTHRPSLPLHDAAGRCRQLFRAVDAEPFFEAVNCGAGRRHEPIPGKVSIGMRDQVPPGMPPIVAFQCVLLQEESSERDDAHDSLNYSFH